MLDTTLLPVHTINTMIFEAAITLLEILAHATNLTPQYQNYSLPKIFSFIRCEEDSNGSLL